MHSAKRSGLSRRSFLKTSALALAASQLPLGSASAQNKGKYVRYSMTSPQGKKMLESYRKGIVALLALPPEDPQNWYRNAFIHTMDCPHGNWWFLPWHRGYIGWFERTIRKYSGDPNFAFPFWDWTETPKVPADFFGKNDPLDVTSSHFIKTYDEFYGKYYSPMYNFFAGATAGQQAELARRGISTVTDLWNQVAPTPPPNNGFFFENSSARCLTDQKPSFADPPVSCFCQGTSAAVSKPTVIKALLPTDFITFGSGIAPYHSDPNVNFGLLESQPHNLVHNCTGGFMEAFLSPVDPLFFMHHSNIERLWDVWTRKQENCKLPTLPSGCDLESWSKEPFLFYIDGDGQPLLDGKAGDYATIGAFDYSYGPGTGDEVIKKACPKVDNRVFASEAMPAELLQAAGADGGPELFAKVSVDTSGHLKGRSFHVLINPPDGLDPADQASAHHVMTLAFFGGHGHGHGHGTATFLVPISDTLRALRKNGRMKANDKPIIMVAADDHHSREKPVAVPAKVEFSVQ